MRHLKSRRSDALGLVLDPGDGVVFAVVLAGWCILWPLFPGSRSGMAYCSSVAWSMPFIPGSRGLLR